MLIKAPDFAERLRERCWIDDAGDCWHWRGALHSEGYPVIYDDERKRNIRARAAVYKRLRGAVSSRAFVTMKCSARDCLNPAHMRLESRSQYMRRAVNHKPADVVARMRESKRRSPSAKLTLDQVREIRRMRTETTDTLQTIAERFKVSRALVSQIARHEVWREASPWAI